MKAGKRGDFKRRVLRPERPRRRLALLILLGGMLLGRLSAQELPVVHYGAAQGLPSVFILAVTQDELGRIWLAHHAGLSMYDGSRFQNWSRSEGLLDAKVSGRNAVES